MFRETDGQTAWSWDFWGTFHYIQASERKPWGGLIWLLQAKKVTCSHCEALRPVFLSQRDEVKAKAALKCEKKPIRNPHWQTQGADKVLRSFIVDTFTETEAGLWIPVRETQEKKRGKRLCRAGNVGAREREREEDSRGGLGLSQTIKALMCLSCSLSSLQHNTQTLSADIVSHCH